MRREYKAIIQIFVIVCAIFVVYAPQEVEAQSQQVCCEQTRSGDSCQYTTQSQCDPRYKSAATSCEQTSFCKLGCGFDTNSGRCFKNTPRATCANTGNCTWSEGAICDAPSCDVGCCLLGSEAALTTQIACKATASQYPDVTMKFNPAITDELECINQVRSVEEGACVKADNSCKFTTRDQCPESPTPTNPRLGFHPRMLCSNPTLQTNCAQQQYTGCLADKDEVYWFDSCGNRENIYSSNKGASYNQGMVLPKDQSCGLSGVSDPNCGNCNFPAGTLCGLAARGEKPAFGDYTCKDLTCRDLPQDNLAISQDGDRKLGESWCAFDGAVGSGKDVVGSRHFKRICINGQVVNEECRDFREEICVEGIQSKPPLGFPEAFRASSSENYVEAACRQNRFQGCTSITNADDCRDLQDFDCYWAGIGTTDPRTGQDAGVCVPQVPPGLKFWQGDAQYVPAADAGDVCSQANQECVMVEYISGAAKYGLATEGTRKAGISETSDWECVQNCECNSPEWVEAASAVCRSMGDCGLNLNILGTAGRDEAFTTSLPYRPQALSPDRLIYLTEQEGKLSFGQYFTSSWGRVVPAAILATYIGFGIWEGSMAVAFPGIYNNLLFALGEDVTVKQIAAETLGQKAVESSGQTWLGVASNVLNMVMWVYLIYQLVDIFGQDTRRVSVTASCGPWLAPRGGDQCEECGADGKPCSEYRCRSLGGQCKLINMGTENEKCIDQNPNDVNSPKITANTTALEEGYTLSEVPNQGFNVNEKIEPFTKVNLGIITDEPSVCKMSLEHSKTYDEMPHTFGESLYDYSHETQFSLPAELADEEILRLTNGGKYTLYVKCSDAAGNVNDKDYYINFEIKPGPDFTPPVIELTSIANGAYVAAGTSQIPVYVFTNEPSSCKWDFTDTEYSNMNNNFVCSTSGFGQSSVYQGLYECGTTLTGIEKDKVSTYYFRCKDQPNNPEDAKRNVNEKSYRFSLIGTEKLEITSIKPQGLIYEPSPIIEVKTSKGAQNGVAVCGFNLEGKTKFENAVPFLETNATIHKQPLTNIAAGDYDIGVVCVDAGGNLATTTTRFTTETDVKGPKLTQIYTEGNLLKIATDEPSTCEYSNEGTFTFGDGTPMTGTMEEKHEATLVDQPYYISCKDKFDNTISIQIFP